MIIRLIFVYLLSMQIVSCTAMRDPDIQHKCVDLICDIVTKQINN